MEALAQQDWWIGATGYLSDPADRLVEPDGKKCAPDFAAVPKPRCVVNKNYCSSSSDGATVLGLNLPLIFPPNNLRTVSGRTLLLAIERELRCDNVVQLRVLRLAVPVNPAANTCWQSGP